METTLAGKYYNDNPEMEIDPPSLLERIALLEKRSEDLRDQLSRRDNEFEGRLARVERHIGCREPLPPSECAAPNRY